MASLFLTCPCVREVNSTNSLLPDKGTRSLFRRRLTHLPLTTHLAREGRIFNQQAYTQKNYTRCCPYPHSLIVIR